MPKAMIITVGMGRGVENAIASSIRSGNPEFVCFLATEESLPTIEKVKQILQENLAEYQVFELKDENDLEESYLRAKEAINHLKKKKYHLSDISTDFTSGTKPMSTGVVLGATSFEIPLLNYVAGRERNENGRVETGTERTMSFRPNIVLQDAKKKLFVRLFNKYQYDSAKEVLSSIQPPDEETNFLIILTSAYSYWDKFDFQNAFQKLEELDDPTFLLKWQINVKKNKEILYQERNEHYSPARAADLLQNVKRRAEEGKYEDAVARLYRLLEFLAQYKLYNNHNQIETSSLDLGKIPKNLREKYEKKKGEKDEIKLSLYESFELLSDLEDSLGKEFITEFNEDEEIKKILGMRNNSILAHGFTPVDEENYQDFVKIASKYAGSTITNLEDLEKKAKFPKLGL